METIFCALYPEASLFPEYYLIKVGHFNNEIKSELDEWIYFFKNSEILESFRAKNIQVAREKLARLKLTPAQQRRHDQYLINLAISKDIVSTARAEAKAKARFEVRIAQLMLASNEPLDKIMRYTGLDEAELHRLSR